MFLETSIDPYFKSEDFALYQEDSLEFLKQFPDNSIDMIFADPPYKLSDGGFTCHSGERVSVDKGDWDKPEDFKTDLKFHREWISLCKSILKPDGTIWISGTYHSIYKCGYLLQKLNYKILNDICWYKPNAPPNLSTRYFTASHETLIWAAKNSESNHTFNYKNMKNGYFPDDKLKRPYKQMRSVWSIPTTPQREKTAGKHPTQKPLALLKRVILSSTNKDELILDPFTGSSTTGIAAYKQDRRFMGIDSKEEYLKLSIDRFKKCRKRSSQKTLERFYLDD
ncbi:MAG: DNA-methyltransferase [Elusimicrobiota bacterium]